MLQVNSDFTLSGSAEKISRELSNERCQVQITGPGLYLTDTETFLVLRNEEDGEDRWHTKGLDLYRVFVWNCPFCQTILSRADAPVRLDTRS